MTDEVTQTDTATSTSEAATTEQSTAPVEQAVEAAPDTTAPETSILGGDLSEEAPPAEAEPEVAAPVIPEKYDLALEGVELDAESVAAAEPVFKELGLSNDQANKLMPVAKQFSERVSQQAIRSIIDAGAQQKADWAQAAKADPEIGGAKFEETAHLAAKGLDALGFGADHTFRKALTETGFGNHPDMIRAFRKIGEMVGEDGFARADAGNPSKPKQFYEKLSSPAAKGV